MAEATRPPERSDLLRLCAELNRLGARYIIIGGLAMNELGLVRVTEDIDLLIDGSIENQKLVRQAMQILPERAIDELGPQEDLREWVVVRVNDEITVDLMTTACGVTFGEAKDSFVISAIGGLEIPFASRALMIRLKQGNREKDRIDLEYLLRSKASGFQIRLTALEELLKAGYRVVDMARKAGVSHIVHLSTIVPEDTDDEHFGWPRYVELYIEHSGIDSVTLYIK